MNILFLQGRNQRVVQNAVLAFYRGAAQGMNGIQYLLRVHTVSTGLLTGKRQLTGQVGDADFVKFIEIFTENAQKKQTVQQRMGFIQRLLQHPDIELQVRELTVNKIFTAVQIDDLLCADRVTHTLPFKN